MSLEGLGFVEFKSREKLGDICQYTMKFTMHIT